MEDRYGRGATIITAQLPLAKWYDYLNEPTIADAIMDRLTAHMHKIELKGESKLENGGVRELLIFSTSGLTKYPTIMDFFGRVATGYCIFQFIAAFRRHGKRG